jgi:hypothetical protein
VPVARVVDPSRAPRSSWEPGAACQIERSRERLRSSPTRSKWTRSAEPRPRFFQAVLRSSSDHERPLAAALPAAPRWTRSAEPEVDLTSRSLTVRARREAQADSSVNPPSIRNDAMASRGPASVRNDLSAGPLGGRSEHAVVGQEVCARSRGQRREPRDEVERQAQAERSAEREESSARLRGTPDTEHAPGAAHQR